MNNNVYVSTLFSRLYEQIIEQCSATNFEAACHLVNKCMASISITPMEQIMLVDYESNRVVANEYYFLFLLMMLVDYESNRVVAN